MDDYSFLSVIVLPLKMGQRSMYPRMGWTIRGSIPGRGKRFFFSSKTSRPALGLTQSHVQWMAEFFPGDKAAGE
jgi:hypothetical protein